MAIITISRGTYSSGKIIAEQVAERLGYECFSRDLLLEASEEFNIPEVKLVRALHDAPSVLSRFTHGKEKYVAFIRQAFLEHVQRDNVVYHGLAGHFFLANVTHVLKVRVIADMEYRVALEAEREGITPDEAQHLLTKDDAERRKWSMGLYEIDTSDASLYDLVLRIRKITVDHAVDVICKAVGLPEFVTTETSKQALEDLLLAARVKSAIVAKYPEAQVAAEQGVVVVHVEGSLTGDLAILKDIKGLTTAVEGIAELRANVRPRFGGIGRFC